jgi:nucleotide sugar dehydrogenase
VKIAVVALGKIGLPLAVQFATKGHQVTGCDVIQATVDTVNLGQEPFPGESDLATKLSKVVASGALVATTDTTAAVAQADAVVIVVPLFVDDAGVPDFGWMDAATASVAKGLKPGTLVSYETTLPVGTTRQRFTPKLEEISGLVAGKDFFVVFSPERVFTGRVFADLRKYPKLVGGIDPASAERGVAFYEAVLDFDERPDLSRANGVWDLGSAEASEMAKLAETTYRDVNIGLANQVIAASNSQPFSHIHQPGIAVGGHCIPIYPRFYLWNDPAATVVQAARTANAQMPEHAVDLLVEEMPSIRGKRIAVLGASYRGGVKETAFSGVFPVVNALKARGALAFVQDPMYSDDELKALGFAPYHLGEEIDGAIVQADHVEYRALKSSDLPGASAIVDGRRVLDALAFPGIALRVIGAARK